MRQDSQRRVGPARVRSPFVPERGLFPPYLAGREQEQCLVVELLEQLADREPPGRDTILYGPRGNGETALLKWAVRDARARRFGTLKFLSKEIKSEEWLAEHLAARPRWLRSLKGLAVLGVRIETRDPPVGRIADMLAGRTRRRGLVLAIDEAHTLAVDTGQHLLHAVQRLEEEKVPVMLLLAGTPDLPRHLGTMEASSSNRGEILPLGRLKPGAAADSIRTPLEAAGRSTTEDTLVRVVAESLGYPYFLQLWGQLLWTATSDPARLRWTTWTAPDLDSKRWGTSTTVTGVPNWNGPGSPLWQPGSPQPSSTPTDVPPARST